MLENKKEKEPRMSLLHTAAAHGRIPTTKYLLTKGISVDVVEPNGLTPLHVAATHGRKEMVAYLLDRKAAIDPHTRVLFLAGLHAGAHTPLHLAVDLCGWHERVRQPDNRGRLASWRSLEAD